MWVGVCFACVYIFGSTGKERGHSTLNLAVNCELQEIFIYFCTEIDLSPCCFRETKLDLDTVTWANRVSSYPSSVLLCAEPTCAYDRKCEGLLRLHLQNLEKEEESPRLCKLPHLVSPRPKVWAGLAPLSRAWRSERHAKPH